MENSQEEQETQSEQFIPAQDVPASIDYKDEGWSWGGFIFNIVFAIATRNYKYLLIMILFFIPVVNIFAIIGAMIYFGVKGREIARNSKTFANKDEYLGFMKGVDHAGKVMFFVYIAMIGAGMLMAITFASLLSARNMAHESQMLTHERDMQMEDMVNQDDFDFMEMNQ